jgi:hypothetical protein
MTYSNLPLSFRVYESLDFLNHVLCSVALTVEYVADLCPMDVRVSVRFTMRFTGM